jgi:glutathione S-transferase
MLVLHGFAVSNYFNMVQLALAVKELDYQTNLVYPNQSPEYLALSPMGKVPALQTEFGVLTETNVILEYLDTYTSSQALYPGSAFEQAKVRELVKICELYIELPARRCHAEAFFGQPVDELTKKEVKRALVKGVEALKRTAKFSPYLAGDKFSAADIVFLYSMELASAVGKRCFDMDLLATLPVAKDLLEKLNQLPAVQKITEERKAGNAEFKKYIASYKR